VVIDRSQPWSAAAVVGEAMAVVAGEATAAEAGEVTAAAGEATARRHAIARIQGYPWRLR
jgi:hypothetical protein